jgi:pyruvate dehydrogenase E1 component
MFAAAGWQVLEVKYGRLLQHLFAREGGSALRERIDQMSNEEYQSLLRAPASTLRQRLAGERIDIAFALHDLSDDDIHTALRDLGGHDLNELAAAFRQVDNDRPSVLFAYTVKGWGLPVQGHPGNHSALLTEEQYRELAARCSMNPDDPGTAFAPDTAPGRLCTATAQRLHREPLIAPPPVPTPLKRTYRGEPSTQAALGRVLTDLLRVFAQPERSSSTPPRPSTARTLPGMQSRRHQMRQQQRREMPCRRARSAPWGSATTRPHSCGPRTPR